LTEEQSPKIIDPKRRRAGFQIKRSEITEKDSSGSGYLVARSSVIPGKQYADYKEFLREDFWYSCAYCSISEVEAKGLGFEIDHYLPQKNHKNKVNEYENLYWSCHHCNNLKGDFEITASMDQEYYIIRADKELHSDHLGINGEELESKSKTGEFNICFFDLNSLSLQRVRQLRRRFNDVAEYISSGIRFLNEFNIDQISPDDRGRFITVREKLLSKNRESAEIFKTLLKELCHSLQIDPDPSRPKRLRARRKYMKEIGAITPDSKILVPEEEHNKYY
jgi:5-methylcytosine-specific restriction endonuclease McrA